MPCRIFTNGFAGGCSSAYAVLWRHKPFNLHYFDPTYFGGISRNHVFHISPTRLNNSIMGNYSTSVLKSHTGATQALTGARES